MFYHTQNLFIVYSFMSLFLSSSAINVSPASDITGALLKLTITGHDFTCPNTNCSGIQ